MKVTTALLRKLEACPDQVKLFAQLYPDGVSYDTQVGLQRLVNKASKQGLDVGWFIGEMKLSCVCKVYYNNGQLEYEENYKNGIRNGVLRGHYETGQLRYKGNYKDGKRNGIWRNYYENGQLMCEDNYKDGKRDGVWRKYYDNGRLLYEKRYKDDKLVKEIR